jgi:hypothetical protein
VVRAVVRRVEVNWRNGKCLTALPLLLSVWLQVWPGEVVYPSYLGDTAAAWLKSQMKNMYDQVPFGKQEHPPRHQ